MKKLWLRKVWQGGLGLSPFSLLASAADAGILWGVGLFLDIANGALNGWGAGEWTLLMLGLLVLRWVAMVARGIRVEALVWHTEGWLRATLAARVRRLDPSWWLRPAAAGDMRQMEEISRQLPKSTELAWVGGQSLLHLLVFVPVLLWLSWPLTLLILVVMGPWLGWLQGRLSRLAKEADSQLRDRGQWLQSWEVFKILGRHWTLSRDLRNSWSTLYRDLRQLVANGRRLGGRKVVWTQATEAIAALSVVLVLGGLGWYINQGGLGPKSLVLFGSALLLCYKPLKELSKALPAIRESMVWISLLEKANAKRQPMRIASVPSLVLHDIQFSYPNAVGLETIVFQGLSLHCDAGHPLLLLGPNGSGKTTLLRLVAGLERPQAGKIELPIVEKGVVPEIAYLGQEMILPPLHFFPWDKLALAMDSNCDSFALFSLLSVGAWHDRADLSLGQRQRLGLAWLVLSGANVWLLDEPVSALPSSLRPQILETLVILARKRNIVLLLATHDASFISADQCKMLMLGTPE